MVIFFFFQDKLAKPKIQFLPGNEGVSAFKLMHFKMFYKNTLVHIMYVYLNLGIVSIFITEYSKIMVHFN